MLLLGAPGRKEGKAPAPSPARGRGQVCRQSGVASWCYPVCHRHWPDTLRKYLWSSPKIFKLSFQGVMGLGFSHLSSTRLRMQMEVWRESKMIQGSYVTPRHRTGDNAGNVSVSIAAAHRTHQAVTRDVCCCQPAAAQGIIMEFLKRLAKF